MRIAIAADLHDNLATWQILNQYLKKQGINTLLFCGDLCDEETLRAIENDFTGDIYLISGNAELYEEKNIKFQKHTHHLGRYGAITLDGLKIGLIHEPAYKEIITRKNPNLNFLFHGHTHKPWIENKAGLIIACPGTLGGVYYKASFALLDSETRQLELKILETL